MAEQRKVRFIRRRGRIIPIRVDKYKREKQAAIAGLGASVGGTIALGVGLGTEKDVDLDKFKKTYAKDIKKTGVKFEQ